MSNLDIEEVKQKITQATNKDELKKVRKSKKFRDIESFYKEKHKDPIWKDFVKHYTKKSKQLEQEEVKVQEEPRIEVVETELPLFEYLTDEEKENPKVLRAEDEDGSDILVVKRDFRDEDVYIELPYKSKNAVSRVFNIDNELIGSFDWKTNIFEVEDEDEEEEKEKLIVRAKTWKGVKILIGESGKYKNEVFVRETRDNIGVWSELNQDLALYTEEDFDLFKAKTPKTPKTPPPEPLESGLRLISVGGRSVNNKRYGGKEVLIDDKTQFLYDPSNPSKKVGVYNVETGRVNQKDKDFW